MPIYLDANVFIYAALQDPQAIPKARGAILYIQQLGKGKIEAATSTLSWDEVMWVALRLLDERSDAIALGKWFLRLPNLKLLPVTNEVVHRAQGLVESHGLKPCDAIHAASAITNRIDELVSDDNIFDRVPGVARVKLSER
ncbi:MAG TPA: type II toxin-antitoxin system VapC family toxin [Nitrososphaerales archaeon]